MGRLVYVAIRADHIGCMAPMHAQAKQLICVTNLFDVITGWSHVCLFTFDL